MYVVKLKYKDNPETYYSNMSIIITEKELKTSAWLDIKDFAFNKEKARDLFNTLIMRNISSETDYMGFYDEKLIHSVSMVEISSYKPYPEWQVSDYREFK